VEIEYEIDREIADARVVAVAEHGLALEVLFVVTEFVLDVRELSIELVLFRAVCGVEAFVSGHSE